MKRTRSLEAFLLERRFAQLMNQDPLAVKGTFKVPSKSGDQVYEMLMVDGYAVHQGEGCLGERFRGPLSCWHSKDFSVNKGDDDMTQMTPYQGGNFAVQTFTPEDIDTLKATICRGASDSELRLFVATCVHTGLDPFMKQIHAVMRKQKDDNGNYVPVMTIQVGIDGYRLIADKTGLFEGSEAGQWSYDGTTWVDVPHEPPETPLVARVVVWRKGIKTPFIGIARWSAYVQMANGVVNSMWAQRGPEQLAKCAEVQALRRAFPAAMSALPQRPEFIDDEEANAYERAEAEFHPSPDAIEAAHVEAEQRWEDTEAYAEAQAALARAQAVGRAAVEREATQEAAVTNDGGRAGNQPPAPSPACEHEPYFSEKSTLMECRKCGVVLEEPPPGTPKQRQLVS